MTRADLFSLIEDRPETAVSLFLPTERGPDGRLANPIRFKNALGRAEQALADRGMGRLEIDELLEPARGLLADAPFWSRQQDGLAVFIAPGETRKFRVPVTLPEQSAVGDRFEVKPVLPLFNHDARFFLLALNREQPRLYEAGRTGMSELGEDRLPDGLAAMTRDRQREQHLQFHTGTADRAGRRSAVFHAQGGGRDRADEKETLLLHRVDREVHELLRGDGAPLVLAGTGGLPALFRQVTSCRDLAPDDVDADPDGLDETELHHRALATVSRLFRRQEEQARARYQDLAATDRHTDRLAELVPAAHAGRVETLFSAVGEQRFGRYDRETGRVAVHEQEEPGDEHLLDLLASRVLLGRGRVLALPRERMPTDGPAAGILRF